jgi:hypothetical protein
VTLYYLPTKEEQPKMAAWNRKMKVAVRRLSKQISGRAAMLTSLFKAITLEVAYLPQIHHHTMFQVYTLNGVEPLNICNFCKANILIYY